MPSRSGAFLTLVLLRGATAGDDTAGVVTELASAQFDGVTLLPVVSYLSPLSAVTSKFSPLSGLVS